MFLTLSSAMSKYGKLRLGLGIRLTKSNAAFLWLILLIKATWYICVFDFWFIYAIFYWSYRGIRAIYNSIKSS